MEFLLNQLLHFLQVTQMKQIILRSFHFSILSLGNHQLFQLLHLFKVVQVKHIAKSCPLGFIFIVHLSRLTLPLVFLVLLVVFVLLLTAAVILLSLFLLSLSLLPILVPVFLVLVFVLMLVLVFVLLFLSPESNKHHDNWIHMT